MSCTANPVDQSPRESTFTSKGKEIDFSDDLGVHISIPKDSTTTGGKLEVSTNSFDAYTLPDDVESVSPAYVIETVVEIEFSKDVTIKLQHGAALLEAEDCKDMVVLRAIPSHNAGSSPQVVQFEEMEGTQVKFSQIGHFGEIKIKNIFSSSYKIGRKKKGGCSSGMLG